MSRVRPTSPWSRPSPAATYWSAPTRRRSRAVTAGTSSATCTWCSRNVDAHGGAVGAGAHAVDAGADAATDPRGVEEAWGAHRRRPRRTTAAHDERRPPAHGGAHVRRPRRPSPGPRGPGETE